MEENIVSAILLNGLFLSVFLFFHYLFGRIRRAGPSDAGKRGYGGETMKCAYSYVGLIECWRGK